MRAPPKGPVINGALLTVEFRRPANPESKMYALRLIQSFNGSTRKAWEFRQEGGEGVTMAFAYSPLRW